MNKYFKLFVFFACGAYLTLHFTQEDHGWRARVQKAMAKLNQTQGSDQAYELTQMAVMNRAVVYIEDHYVEPSRVNRPKMVAAGLEQIQRAVPEIMVNLDQEGELDPTSAEVQVNDHKKRFSLKINSRFELLFKFRDIFRFIQGKLKHFSDLREIEYAAINGMLSTLDPHSILLSPEEYAEMHLSTKGRFGGLGILIGIRDNHLTVINPIEDTPASRAGIKANDHIVQINLDSTVNMSLSDAVNLMRGEPGTDVGIFVMREGWKSPKKFTLTRDHIKVKSVKYKYLGKGVGLVRVRNFQNTTVNELKSALDKLKKVSKRSKLKGLVLDLRGNPGGLLDQAAKMSDLFISRGTIVKTVGSGDKLREPKMARPKGTIKDLPIVVMLNSSSASASEIVAGALKNHDRALVLGQRSFGKGTVQLLFDNPDQSALKLTIAQYLTPGDISIQSVGITPTVELSPVLLTEDTTYFFGAPDEAHGEALLPEHLESEKSEASKSQKPLMSLRYLRDYKLLKEQRDKPNELIIDFETRFAQNILVESKGYKLKQLLKASEVVLSRELEAQEKKIDETLTPKDIQWSSKVTKASAKGVAQVQLSPENGQVKAGDTLKITVTVKNTSKHALHKVRGITKSENRLFKGHEFLLGFIPPQESRSWSEEVKVDASFINRQDTVKVVFEADGQGEVLPLEFKSTITALPVPHLALRYELNDHESGDGNGLLSPGEEVELLLFFKNIGKGESRELVGQLGNEGKGKVPGIFIKRGRVTPEDQVISPNEEGILSFLFRVKEGWSEPEVKAYLSLVDPALRESTSDKVTLAVHAKEDLKKIEGQLKAKRRPSHLDLVSDTPTGKRLTIRSSPIRQASVIGYLSEAQTKACVQSGSGECVWYRVQGEDHRYYWVEASEVKFSPISEAQTTVTATELSYELNPPVITLDTIPLEVIQSVDEVEIKGRVVSTQPLLDLMVYVNRRKVFFLPKPAMKNPHGIDFKAKVPLEGGVNHVTIYARVSEEVTSISSAFIFRPKSKEEQAKDPKK